MLFILGYVMLFMSALLFAATGITYHVKSIVLIN